MLFCMHVSCHKSKIYVRAMFQHWCGNKEAAAREVQFIYRQAQSKGCDVGPAPTPSASRGSTEKKNRPEIIGQTQTQTWSRSQVSSLSRSQGLFFPDPAGRERAKPNAPVQPQKTATSVWSAMNSAMAPKAKTHVQAAATSVGVAGNPTAQIPKPAGVVPARYIEKCRQPSWTFSLSKIVPFYLQEV